MFEDLDVNENSLLSRSELAAFADGTISPLLLDAIYLRRQAQYDNCRIQAGGDSQQRNQLTFSDFVEFIAAIEQPGEQASVRFLFECLDAACNGYLTSSDLCLILRVLSPPKLNHL
jgi:hypothetical protein